MDGIGMERQKWTGRDRTGKDGSGVAGSGMAETDRTGPEGKGKERTGTEGRGRKGADGIGMDGNGLERRGRNGPDRTGLERMGTEWQGAEWQKWIGQDRTGEEGTGSDGRGLEGNGSAGKQLTERRTIHMTNKKNGATSTYQWHKNYRGPRKVMAEAAQEELERIREEQGAVCAEYIIEAAKPKDSILHPEFEWDNSKAAASWRRQQAQQMIRCIVVSIENIKEPMRAYALVSSEVTDCGTDYAGIQTIIRDEDLFADAMNRLLDEVKAAKHSVDELANLAKAANARKKITHVKKISKALTDTERIISNP